MTRIVHKVVSIPKPSQLLTWPVVAAALSPRLESGEVPLRLALTEHRHGQLSFEVTSLRDLPSDSQRWGSLWNFSPRRPERSRRFVAVHVVPTGIRAEIGGFAGDATPATNLMASVCDAVLTHPNVVTASDLYWARENILYLEGNLLSRFLTGQIHLLPGQVRKVGVLVDRPPAEEFLGNVMNAIHAARTVGGLGIEAVWVSEVSLSARVFYGDSGRALGEISELDRIFKVAKEAETRVDALAITSHIAVSSEVRRDYYAGKPLANPWGGAEATLTHAVTSIAGLPVAHAPMLMSWANTRLDGPVDPRDGAEVISTAYLCSVLRGLTAAPKPISASQPTSPGVDRLTLEEIGALVLPAGAMGGIPAFAALAQKIPIIAVTENKTLSPIHLEDLMGSEDPARPEVYVVSNYLEATGILAMLKARISLDTVRRPIGPSRTRHA